MNNNVFVFNIKMEGNETIANGLSESPPKQMVHLTIRTLHWPSYNKDGPPFKMSVFHQYWPSYNKDVPPFKMSVFNQYHLSCKEE